HDRSIFNLQAHPTQRGRQEQRHEHDPNDRGEDGAEIHLRRAGANRDEEGDRGQQNTLDDDDPNRRRQSLSYRLEKDHAKQRDRKLVDETGELGQVQSDHPHTARATSERPPSTHEVASRSGRRRIRSFASTVSTQAKTTPRIASLTIQTTSAT